MFSNRIIGSARFIKMPPSIQALYFHLCLNADDDGVVEAYPIMRMLGSTEDDVRILNAKNLVTVLNEDLVSYITDWLEHNSLRADRKVDSVYQNLLLQMVPEAEIIEPKPRSDVEDNSKRLNGPSTDGIGKDRIGKVNTKACVSKNSKGEDLSSVPASDYQPDGWSPSQVMAMKKRASRVLGIRKTNAWSQLLFGSAWDFKKAYTKFQGVDYVGEIFVDEMARTLATWYEAGETRDTIRGLIVEYFQSEKAERLAVTPNACFSDHTYQSWKQGKLNKNKDNSILKSWGV